MPQHFQDLLEPIVNDLGYELWHMESVGGGKQKTLRLYIDSPDGIDLDDCEVVSHEVSAALDVATSDQSSYQLEVSSPGLDRPLVTTEHFHRFIGERARIKMYVPVAGQRRFDGVIESASAETVDLLCDGARYVLPIGDMAKARLNPVFDDSE